MILRHIKAEVFVMDTFLLIKYFKCATSPEEEKQVIAWLVDDPDGSHARQYEDAHTLYNGMILHSTKDAFRRKNHSKRHIVSTASRKVLSVCANVAAIVLVVFSVYFIAKNEVYEDLSVRMETISVPAGKNIQITLEDGTEMFLNSGTVVEYPKVFSNKKREVRVLQGEVLFDVTSEKDRPFYVETYASSVKVLGTRFNVVADPDMDICSTTLLRGLVQISNKVNDETVVLNPNMTAEIVGGSIKVSNVDDVSGVTCWTDGLIDIKSVSFDRLMRIYELAFNVNVVIDRESLPEVRYTRGKVRVSDGLDHALNVLKMASDFTYERDYESNTIFIR